LEKEFLDIGEVAEYLNIRQSTLYTKVGAGILPHYRIGRLIRFKKADIDRWMEGQRKEIVDISVGKFFRPRKSQTNADRIIRKTIDTVKGMAYNPVTGKPDQVKGPGKEGNNNGAL
jgi:excisionase family DNA binding protein